MKIYSFFSPYIFKVSIFAFLFVLLTGIPLMAHASFLSVLSNVFIGERKVQAADNTTSLVAGAIYNSQTIPLLESSIRPNVKKKKSNSLVTIVGNNALSANDSFMGSGLEENSSGGITVYKVKKGDTLSQIALDFDVSVNTIRWENHISGQKIMIGQKLNILPVTGVKRVVKRGDTLIGIANRYDANLNDILVFNGISKKDILKTGEIIYVPNGIIKRASSRISRYRRSRTVIIPSSQRAPRGYFIVPVIGPITSPYGPRRGGFHYGVDIGARRGTPARAAAFGTIITAVNYCVEGRIRCGGGYGNYIVMRHPNGMMTRYAHLSRVLVRVGQRVRQGQIIARTGNTGHTTGPHIHFEEENSYGSKLRPVF